MSQSPRTKGPPPTIPLQNVRAVAGPAPHSSKNGQIAATSSRSAVSDVQHSSELTGTTFLPPVAAITGESGHRQHVSLSQSSPKWRSTGIQSILNPASDLSRRYASAPANHIESLGGRAAPVVAVPSFPSPRMRKRGEIRSPSRGMAASQDSGRMDRRILTPRSPSLRAANLGRHRSPSLNRATVRGGDGRIYTAEPGERVDSAIVPSMPAMPIPHAGVSASHTISRAAEHHESSVPGLTSPHSLGLMVNTRAPTTLRRSGSPPLQRSPSMTSQSQTPVPKSEFPPGFTPTSNPASRPGEHYTHQGWILALEGGAVDVHVDNQQASKMADEKRKRNAGASARFRARRKEREKEASQTISGLQAELRGMADDRDFYMNERNYFRELIVRHQLGPLPPRPPSPPRRVHGLVSISHDSDLGSDYGRRETTEIPEQRLRMGDPQPSFAQESAPVGPPPPSNTIYHGPYAPSAGLNYPFPPVLSSSAFHDARSSAAAPPPVPPMSLPRPQPRDTFSRDVLERKWNSGK